MYLPPGMLESLDHKYRPEPFDSTVATTAVAVTHISSGHEGLVHPVKKFDVQLASSAELVSGLIISFAGLYLLANIMWNGGMTGIRSGLALAPFCLLIFFHAIKTLHRRHSSDYWHNSIILEADRLIHERGHELEPKGIYFEQICAVKSRIVYARASFNKEDEQPEVGPVQVDYYLYNERTGTLDLSRLRSIVLPKTGDDARLCDEIGRRSFGPAPSRWARVKLIIRQCCQLALMLLVVPLYVFGVIVVTPIIAAIVT